MPKTAPKIELTIGELIRRTRRNRDMNQELAARELKVNQSTVAKWERGDRPRPEKLNAIAKFVGMPLPQVLQLYHGTGDKDLAYAATIDEINERLADMNALVQQIPELLERIEELEAAAVKPAPGSPAGGGPRTRRRPDRESAPVRAKSRR